MNKKETKIDTFLFHSSCKFIIIITINIIYNKQ